RNQRFEGRFEHLVNGRSERIEQKPDGPQEDDVMYARKRTSGTGQNEDGLREDGHPGRKNGADTI
ncbi:MAG TPA: hypothetical protein VJM79_08765, partial [Rhizorhapis sp.]|nr:hypothetical protein [Rhizorhapis sp.]